jgi:nitric oxide reductase large subunit
MRPSVEVHGDARLLGLARRVQGIAKQHEASQRKVGKYFLVVACVFLLQILVGSIMAHYYSERTDFYGIKIDSFLPFNFLRDVHIQTPLVWISSRISGERPFHINCSVKVK